MAAKHSNGVEPSILPRPRILVLLIDIGSREEQLIWTLDPPVSGGLITDNEGATWEVKEACPAAPHSGIYYAGAIEKQKSKPTSDSLQAAAGTP